MLAWRCGEYQVVSKSEGLGRVFSNQTGGRMMEELLSNFAVKFCIPKQKRMMERQQKSIIFLHSNCIWGSKVLFEDFTLSHRQETRWTLRVV